MIAIHGREKGEQDEIDLSTRLQAMADIVRKLWAWRLDLHVAIVHIRKVLHV